LGATGRHQPHREKRQEAAPVHRVLHGWNSHVPVCSDYVAEDGATQMVDPCALSDGLHHKGAARNALPQARIR